MNKDNILKIVNEKIAKNQFNEAIELTQNFLEENKSDIDFLFVQGICYFQINNYVKSIEIFKKVILLNPAIWNAYLGLAKNYRKLNQAKIAYVNFNKAIELNPNNYSLLLEYSDFLVEQNKNDIAESVLNRLISIDPENYRSFYQLGLMYLATFQEKKAINFFLRSNKLCPDNAEILNAIGTCYEKILNFDLAKSYFLKSFQSNNLFFLPLLNLAVMEQSLGNFDNSKKLLKQIIDKDPYNGEAYRNLSIMKKYIVGDEEIETMKTIYKTLQIGNNKMHLGFALSKALEDIGDFKNSALYLIESNDYRRNQFPNFNIKKEANNFNLLKEVLSYDFYKKNMQYGFKSDMPIFVIGMPRSGTTLVEQILSSHSMVKAGGELNEMSKALNEEVAHSSSADMFQKIANLSPENINNIGKNYCRSLRLIDGTSKHITDKLPLNFQLVSLIFSCMPNAKIIHCTRDARDNCLSIYKNYFWQEVMPWSYNQIELNLYYNLYNNLMIYYNSVFKSKIFNISYESLISNPEKIIKELIRYCDLGWEENCLQFYESKNVVKTASVAQVRNKLYASSVNSWEKYQDFLPDLFFNLKSGLN
jgi:tetratricopeptide (TPR) repeat protein